jgi:RNA polymerase primary sigma factor
VPSEPAGPAAKKRAGKAAAKKAAPAGDGEPAEPADEPGPDDLAAVDDVEVEPGEPGADGPVDPAVVLATDPTLAAVVADGVADGAVKAADDEEDDEDDDTPKPASDDDDEDEKPIAAEGEVGISTDLVRAYLKEIGKVPLLTAEQEVELAQRIEAGLFAAEKVRQAEEGEAPKLSAALRRDLEWLVMDGGRPSATCSRPTCAWSSRSPSATWAAGCSSSTSSRRATSA